MLASNSHIEYLKDLLNRLPHLLIRQMFGCAGLYSESVYLYQQDGGVEFTYMRKDCSHVLPLDTHPHMGRYSAARQVALDSNRRLG